MRKPVVLLFVLTIIVSSGFAQSDLSLFGIKIGMTFEEASEIADLKRYGENTYLVDMYSFVEKNNNHNDSFNSIDRDDYMKIADSMYLRFDPVLVDIDSTGSVKSVGTVFTTDSQDKLSGFISGFILSISGNFGIPDVVNEEGIKYVWRDGYGSLSLFSVDTGIPNKYMFMVILM